MPSDGEGCQSETTENVDLDAVQSLLAMSQWSPPYPERNTPSPDSGLSSISRNSSSASLSSTTSVEDEPEKVRSLKNSDYVHPNVSEGSFFFPLIYLSFKSVRSFHTAR